VERKQVVIVEGGGRGTGATESAAKLIAADSGGRLAVTEQLSEHGQDLHVHPGLDEAFYVLAGEGTFRAGRRTVGLVPGSFLYLPGSIPHGFSSTGREPLRLLVLSLPAI
jgi:mannose-6-phosphate isomerase-like protein (cupin superfamily)